MIPQIHSVMKFSRAVNYAGELDISLFRMNLLKIWRIRKNCLNRSNRDSPSVSLSDRKVDSPEEIELAMNHQVQPITLGKRILRTETAGMTVLSILMFLLEGKE